MAKNGHSSLAKGRRFRDAATCVWSRRERPSSRKCRLGPRLARGRLGGRLARYRRPPSKRRWPIPSSKSIVSFASKNVTGYEVVVENHFVTMVPHLRISQLSAIWNFENTVNCQQWLVVCLSLFFAQFLLSKVEPNWRITPLWQTIKHAL